MAWYLIIPKTSSPHLCLPEEAVGCPSYSFSWGWGGWSLPLVCFGDGTITLELPPVGDPFASAIFCHFRSWRQSFSTGILEPDATYFPGVFFILFLYIYCIFIQYLDSCQESSDCGGIQIYNKLLKARHLHDDSIMQVASPPLPVPANPHACNIESTCYLCKKEWEINVELFVHIEWNE